MKRTVLSLATASLLAGAPLAFADEAWLADFRRADLNDSGGLSKVELDKSRAQSLNHLKSNFTTADADRDGQVTVDEYRRFAGRSDDFAGKFKKADLNDSGGLSRRELQNVSGPEFDFIENNFDAMDADRDGQIAYTEYQNFQGRMPAPARAAGAAPQDMCGPNCGTVVEVDRYKVDGEGGMTGMIAGGVAGGLLGNQVGKGTGNTIATLGGAAAGAYAGNEVQKRMSTKKMVKVTVRFDNGQQRNFDYEAETSPFPRGSRVRLRDGQLEQFVGQ